MGAGADFQAEYEGSIPFTRSNFIGEPNHDAARLRCPVLATSRWMDGFMP
jgi:hypothetical protein